MCWALNVPNDRWPTLNIVPECILSALQSTDAAAAAHTKWAVHIVWHLTHRREIGMDVFIPLNCTCLRNSSGNQPLLINSTQPPELKQMLQSFVYILPVICTKQLLLGRYVIYLCYLNSKDNKNSVNVCGSHPKRCFLHYTRGLVLAKSFRLPYRDAPNQPVYRALQCRSWGGWCDDRGRQHC